MDKLLVRKDVYEELLEKGFGKKDLSKLTKKQITDKNGHKRTVYVRNGEQPVTQKQTTAQKELSPEKRARYEEMLEKVKAGPNENALFIGSKGMLNKKDAIAYLENKLGKKSVSSAAQGHLESYTPQNTDITKEDEERFGKQALSGLSGKRTGNNDYEDLMARKKVEYADKVKKQGYDYQELRETGELPDGLSAKALREIRDKAKKDGSQDENTRNLVLAAQERMDELSRENYAKKQAKNKQAEEYKENYLDAKNEGGRDIADENRIDNHADKAFNLDKSDTKALDKFFEKLSKDTTYKPHYVIGNYLSKENKELFSKLHKMEDEYKEKHPEAEGKTFAYDLSEKYIKDEFEKFKKKKTIDSFAETFKELLD